MKRLLIMALLAPAAALAAENQATLCTHGDNQRTIEVTYPSGEALPCEVLYDKDGDTSVLWSASNEAGYCESKAEAFIAKQVDWGWQCDSDSEAAVAEMEPQGESDDAGETAVAESETESGGAGEDQDTMVAEAETESESE